MVLLLLAFNFSLQRLHLTDLLRCNLRFFTNLVEVTLIIISESSTNSLGGHNSYQSGVICFTHFSLHCIEKSSDMDGKNNNEQKKRSNTLDNHYCYY